MSQRMMGNQEHMTTGDHQTGIRPRFLLELAIIAALIALFTRVLLPTGGGPGSDRRITRHSMSLVATTLDELSAAKDKGTNIESDAIISALLRSGMSRAVRTNSQGELVDVWGTAYQFTIVSPGTCTIRSAGKDRKLGTGDDIVYSSGQRSFVEP